MSDLATEHDLEQAWRPLTPQEQPRARYLIRSASRRILRRWPETPDRIASGDLDARDVAEVVVEMVLTVLAGPPVPGARSWSVSSGQESRSVTLGALAAAMTIEAWMVELFEGRSAAAARPVGAFPPAARWPDPAVVRWPETAR